MECVNFQEMLGKGSAPEIRKVNEILGLDSSSAVGRDLGLELLHKILMGMPSKI